MEGNIKVSELRFLSSSANENLKFEYDAMGNRIAKHVYDELGVLQHSTFYVRDAQGNVMAVYEQEVTVPEGEGPPATPSITYHLTERHIYGSARLGMDRTVVEMAPTTIQAYPLEPTIPATEESERYLGRKYYELSNHLGNVLTVITDEKRMVVSGNNYSHYESVVVSVTDYSPFGVSLTGRTFTTTEEYRYGFNGKESDPEHNSGAYDFGARIMDARLGRWMSVDALFRDYPNQSVYGYVESSPLMFIDPDGNRIMWFRLRSALRARNSLLKTEKGREIWNDLRRSGSRIHIHFTKDVILEPTNRKDVEGRDLYRVAGGMTTYRKPVFEVSPQQSESTGRATRDGIARHKGTARSYSDTGPGDYPKTDDTGYQYYKAVDIYISEGSYNSIQDPNGDYNYSKVEERKENFPFGLIPNVLKTVEAPVIDNGGTSGMGMPSDPNVRSAIGVYMNILKFIHGMLVHEGRHTLNNPRLDAPFSGQKNENREDKPYADEKDAIEQFDKID